MKKNIDNGVNDMYDVAVIGGGPAGMMAAGRAAELGARVVLIEKNPRLGAKLLATGGGRCNLTNNITSKELADRLGKNGKFLLSGLSRFGSIEVMDFFESRGLKLKEENNHRIFPVSDRALDVLVVLEKYLRSSKVMIKTGRGVTRFIREEDKIIKIILDNDEEVLAEKFIFATGGKSYPSIGATGDGYKWSKKLGHSLADLHPALSPIIVNEAWVKNIEGAPLQGVELLLKSSGKVLQKATGDGIVTANGFSGPVAHDLSKRIGVEQKNKANLVLVLNLFPELDFEKVFKTDFDVQGKLMLKTYLAKILTPKMLPQILAMSGIDPELHLSSISKVQRQLVAGLLNNLTFNVKGVVGYDKAIVTAGGVSLGEVDGRTMKSKLIDNLYFAGEILDLDGPTGGYNLQICWTSGYVAGEASTKD